ncbi:hypothetical protein LT330_001582 [Penicillium expansum]|nr:hypothetical protein LT330_001582 [Penicillium expansum]
MDTLRKRLTPIFAFPFSRTVAPPSPPSPAHANFLELCAGGHTVDTPEDCTAYLVHVNRLSGGKWNDAWNELLHPDYTLPNSTDDFDIIIQLCSEVAQIMLDHGVLSMARIIQKLEAKKVLCPAVNIQCHSNAHGLTFSLIGWLLLLYVPARKARPNEMQAAEQRIRSGLRYKVSPELVNRPLDELLRSFGNILPRREEQRDSAVASTDLEEARVKLEVTHLNAAALKTMANIQIRVLNKFYEDDEKPTDNFSVAKMINEVMLSYTLLFKADRKSRKLYQTTERTKASLIKPNNDSKPYIDPVLDELCGNHISSSFFKFGEPVREYYDSITDFPIFKDRLRRIQDYMQGIQPNRFVSLWRDQRDLRLWYTIWMVIIFGVISIVLGLIAMFLTAIQVDYAKKAYELQVKQGG